MAEITLIWWPVLNGTITVPAYREMSIISVLRPLCDRRGFEIESWNVTFAEVYLAGGEIVGWDFCDCIEMAEHNGKYCDAFNRKITAAQEIYNADPFGNRAFYTELFGEETVEMPTGDTYKCEGCGETVKGTDQPTHFNDECKDTREMYPRVTFRDAQDAEMVVELLRNGTERMGHKAAQALKVWGTHRVLHAVNLETHIRDGENNHVTDPAALVKEITEAMTQMLGLMEAVTAQLGGGCITVRESPARTTRNTWSNCSTS